MSHPIPPSLPMDMDYCFALSLLQKDGMDLGDAWACFCSSNDCNDQRGTDAIGTYIQYMLGLGLEGNLSSTSPRRREQARTRLLRLRRPPRKGEEVQVRLG